MYTDAAPTVGMVYLLLQRKGEGNKSKGYHIVSCDSTTFRKALCQYSLFEAKLMAITFMYEKEDYNICGAPTVPISCDAKNMY